MLFINIIIKYVLYDIHCMLNYCVVIVWWFVVLMTKHGIQWPLLKQKQGRRKVISNSKVLRPMLSSVGNTRYFP